MRKPYEIERNINNLFRIGKELEYTRGYLGYPMTKKDSEILNTAMCMIAKMINKENSILDRIRRRQIRTTQNPALAQGATP